MTRNSAPRPRAAVTCALLAVAAAAVGCGVAGGPAHQLTFELTGPEPSARTVTVDPPGEQADNVESLQQVPLPWSQARSSGYGFARLAATSNGPLTCTIRDGDAVVATQTGRPGEPVECRANIQDQ